MARPAAAETARDRSVSLLEPFEKPALHAFIESDPGILDEDANTGSLLLDDDGRRAHVRELHRVRNQVSQDLAEAQRIAKATFA